MLLSIPMSTCQSKLGHTRWTKTWSHQTATNLDVSDKANGFDSLNLVDHVPRWSCSNKANMLFCFRSLNPKAICWSGWDAPQILPTPKNSGYGGHLFSCQDLYDFLCSIGCKNIHDTETLDSHQILKKTKPHTHRKKIILTIANLRCLAKISAGCRIKIFTALHRLVCYSIVCIYHHKCLWAINL